MSTGHVDQVIADLAELQHGVVARRQLLALEISRARIDGQIRRGRLHPVYRGVYAVGHRRVSLWGWRWAALLAAGPGAALSHRSAGSARGLLAWSGRPEATRPSGWLGPSGVLLHHSPLPADEIEDVEGISVTSVSRTLLDLSAVLDSRALERAMNEAEVLHLTSRVPVQALLDRYPRRRGSATLRRLLDEDAASRGVTKQELETRFAAVLDAHRLPAPRRNADIAVGGRFFNADCLWRPQRVIVELDSRAVHGTERAFETDRYRDRLLLVDGWKVMHVTWAQLRNEPRSIINDLNDLLAARNA